MIFVDFRRFLKISQDFVDFKDFDDVKEFRKILKILKIAKKMRRFKFETQKNVEATKCH